MLCACHLHQWARIAIGFVWFVITLLFPMMAHAHTVDDIKNRLVQLEVKDANNPKKTLCGVGVLVTPHIVMTAMHVIDLERHDIEEADIILRTHDGRERKVHVGRGPDSGTITPGPGTSDRMRSLDVGFLAFRGEPFAGISEEDGPLLAKYDGQFPLRNAVMMGYDPPCHKTPGPPLIKDVTVEAPKIHQVDPDPSDNDTTFRVDSQRMGIPNAAEKAGYSGSVIFSVEHGFIVGVFTGAVFRDKSLLIDGVVTTPAWYDSTVSLPAQMRIENAAVAQRYWSPRFRLRGVLGADINHLTPVPWPLGSVGFEAHSELVLLNAFRYRDASLGWFVGGYVLYGKQRTTFLAPGNELQLEPAIEDWFPGGRFDAGVEMRFRRDYRLDLAIGLGIRGEYLFHGVEIATRSEPLPWDGWALGPVARATGTFRISTKINFNFEFDLALSNLPSTSYMYTGVGAELNMAARRWALVPGVRFGVEYDVPHN